MFNNISFINIKQEIKTLLSLALPIIATQLAYMLIGFADVVIAGRFDSAILAAISIANSLYLPIFLFISGVVMILASKISHLIGQNKQEQIANIFHQTLFLACLLSVLEFLILINVEKWIFILDSTKEVEKQVISYLFAFLPGCLMMNFYAVFRNVLDGFSLTKPAMYFAFLTVPINVFLNLLLIEKFAAFGLGLASSISIFISLICIVVYLRKEKFKSYNLWQNFKFKKESFQDICYLGFPIGLSIFAETSIFSVIALLLADNSVDIISGHSIALNFSSITFMIVLSLATATTIRVSYYCGANNQQFAHLNALLSLCLGLLYALFCCLLILFFKENISQIYTQDKKTILVASSLLTFAAIYQFSDALQVVSVGILRGFLDTKYIPFWTIFAYWFVGMPSGFLLSYLEILPKAQALWCGLIIGLSTAAFLMLRALISKHKIFLL